MNNEQAARERDSRGLKNVVIHHAWQMDVDLVVVCQGQDQGGLSREPRKVKSDLVPGRRCHIWIRERDSVWSLRVGEF